MTNIYPYDAEGRPPVTVAAGTANVPERLAGEVAASTATQQGAVKQRSAGARLDATADRQRGVAD